MIPEECTSKSFGSEARLVAHKVDVRTALLENEGVEHRERVGQQRVGRRRRQMRRPQSQLRHLHPVGRRVLEPQRRPIYVLHVLA